MTVAVKKVVRTESVLTDPVKTAQEERPIVLVCEDDAAMRELVASIVSRLDVNIVQAESSQHALDYLENNDVALFITDLRMPGVDGLELLRFARGKNSLTQVIMITGNATVESAVEALKCGAFDYIRKPFDTDELRYVAERALEHYHLHRENRELREQNRLIRETEGFIGRSQSVTRMRKLIDAAAAYDCTVLITGQSGCGKELVARQIHTQSKRSDKRFVAINCAAIPENIIESELFGYMKGAFTGADRNKPGLFEAADAVRCFWMKSITPHCPCRPSCCVFCRTGPFIAWATRHPAVLTYGFWPPATAISRISLRKVNFARISITGSRLSKFIFRHCTKGVMIFRCW